MRPAGRQEARRVRPVQAVLQGIGPRRTIGQCAHERRGIVPTRPMRQQCERRAGPIAPADAGRFGAAVHLQQAQARGRQRIGERVRTGRRRRHADDVRRERRRAPRGRFPPQRMRDDQVSRAREAGQCGRCRVTDVNHVERGAGARKPLRQQHREQEAVDVVAGHGAEDAAPARHECGQRAGFLRKRRERVRAAFQVAAAAGCPERQRTVGCVQPRTCALHPVGEARPRQQAFVDAGVQVQRFDQRRAEAHQLQRIGTEVAHELDVRRPRCRRRRSPRPHPAQFVHEQVRHDALKNVSVRPPRAAPGMICCRMISFGHGVSRCGVSADFDGRRRTCQTRHECHICMRLI